MLRVFIGADPRQPVGPQVLGHSISWRSSKPVSITNLVLAQLPMKRMGLTQFTFSRFLVPWLCDYQGLGLFLDADMVVTGDIAELFALKDESAVQVVKNKLRFEWPSMMLFDCSKCKVLTPEFIDDSSHNPLALKWAESIGELPSIWNHCVGYDRKQALTPKLIHYTKGLPCWPETKECDYSEIWWDEFKRSNSTVSYEELMGRSVHARGA